MTQKRFAPIHPGEVFEEEFLKPLSLPQYRLAKGLRVPARRINEIVLGKRAITADTALRLGRFFRNSAVVPLPVVKYHGLARHHLRYVSRTASPGLTQYGTQTILQNVVATVIEGDFEWDDEKALSNLD